MIYSFIRSMTTWKDDVERVTGASRKLASENSSNPKDIFIDLEASRIAFVEVAQEAVDAYGRLSNKQEIKKIKQKMTVVVDRLLTMVVAYEFWLESNDDLRECENSYSDATLLLSYANQVVSAT